MQETVQQRIKNVRLRLGLNQTDFAYRINIAQTTLSNIEKGTKNLTERTKSDICRVYKVRKEYIENGIGEMFEPSKTATDEDILDILKNCYNKLNEEEQKTIIKLIKSVRDYKII